jgi:hypothetical protein
MGDEGSWSLLLEDLLRGLVHAMNNRVTALSAFAELATVDEEALEIDMLRREIVRLYEVSSLVSALATRSDEREALEMSGVVEMALDIHRHHPRMRSVPCTLEKKGAILPVRVPRWAMLRLALLMVDAAKRAGTDANADVVAMWLSSTDAAVRLHMLSPALPSPDAQNLAKLCGGVLSHDDGETVLSLPSLLELRRRERSGQEGETKRP